MASATSNNLGALQTLAATLLKNGPFRHEATDKKVQAAFGGEYIVSTTPAERALLVWEAKGAPRYYVPAGRLKQQLQNLRGTAQTEQVATVAGSDGASNAVIERLVVGGKHTLLATFTGGALSGYVRLDYGDIDAWFEDGTLLFGYPKNPSKRIDTLHAAHDIAVEVDGVKVAETKHAVRLFETGLPVTYYVPATSILNWGIVEKSDLKTECPYKGVASYLSLNVNGKKLENMIWYYPYPTHESAAVQGLLSFYNKEGVRISVDGAIL